jgi:hypothetical protein
MRTIDLISHDHALGLQFSEPPVDQRAGILIEWVQKAREESRGCARLSRIVGNRPQLDEQKSRIPRQSTYAFRLAKLGFYRADARHVLKPLLRRKRYYSRAFREFGGWNAFHQGNLS